MNISFPHRKGFQEGMKSEVKQFKDYKAGKGENKLQERSQAAPEGRDESPTL